MRESNSSRRGNRTCINLGAGPRRRTRLTAEILLLPRIVAPAPSVLVHRAKVRAENSGPVDGSAGRSAAPGTGTQLPQAPNAINR